MRAGVISAPEGSTLTLKVTASQNLASAADAQGKPLRVEGSSVVIPDIRLEKDPREIELTWTDSDGLAASQPVRMRLEPIEDKQPSIYLRGGENDRYVLEDTSIELEVEAADDFGLRERGWNGRGKNLFTTMRKRTPPLRTRPRQASPFPACAGKRFWRTAIPPRPA